MFIQTALPLFALFGFMPHSVDWMQTPRSLLPETGLTAFSMPSNTNIANYSFLPSGEAGFSQVLKIQTIQTVPNPWDIQVSVQTVGPISKGDVLLATFWMRTVHATNGYGRTNLIFENVKTFRKSARYEAHAASNWQQFSVPFVAAEDLGTGTGQLNFQAGFLPQTIEIANVNLLNYRNFVSISSLPTTRQTYDSREADAPWRRTAIERIERIRKGNLLVHVVDAKNEPVTGATVSVEMTRHAFPFGTAVDNIYLRDTPESRKYRQMTQQLFTMVVPGCALKWPEWEGRYSDASGVPYSRDDALRLVSLLRSQGMIVRGHNLVWPSWSNEPFLKPLEKTPKLLADRVNAHVRDEVQALRGKCADWDVINEPFDNHDLMDVLGRQSMVDWYQIAHQADPKARLFLNDYNIIEADGENVEHIKLFNDTVRYLQENHAPLSGLGLQSHFGDMVTPPEHLLKELDELAQKGLILEGTEFDVDSSDEQLRADYLRDYYTVMFSHPAVHAIVMWGFWAGDDYLPKAALFDKDWHVRANGKTYMDLVLHQWWTMDAGLTDGQGSYHVRGFLGDYRIKVTDRKGHTVSLGAQILKNSDGQTVLTVKI